MFNAKAPIKEETETRVIPNKRRVFLPILSFKKPAGISVNKRAIPEAETAKPTRVNETPKDWAYKGRIGLIIEFPI